MTYTTDVFLTDQLCKNGAGIQFFRDFSATILRGWCDTTMSLLCNRWLSQDPVSCLRTDCGITLSHSLHCRSPKNGCLDTASRRASNVALSCCIIKYRVLKEEGRFQKPVHSAMMYNFQHKPSNVVDKCKKQLAMVYLGNLQWKRDVPQTCGCCKMWVAHSIRIWILR